MPGSWAGEGLSKGPFIIHPPSPPPLMMWGWGWGWGGGVEDFRGSHGFQGGTEEDLSSPTELKGVTIEN